MIEDEEKPAAAHAPAAAKRLEPPPIRFVTCDQHSANFAWERSEEDDLDGWLLVFKIELASSHDGLYRIVYSGPDSSCEVDGLRAGTEYLARLRIEASPLVAVSHQEGPLSEPSAIECSPDPSPAIPFITQPSPPSAPAPPSLASRERKALKLKWAQPESSGGPEPLSYTLYCSPPPSYCIVEEGSIKARDTCNEPLPFSFTCDSDGFAEVYEGQERSYKVCKLLPGVRYTFKLKASNSLGSSMASHCSTFTTQATVPAPPEEPMILSTSSNSVTLVWWPPMDNGSPINSYRLEVDQGRKAEPGSGGHVSSYELAYAGIATTATVGGLHHGLLYSFRLLAENSEGKSLWSSSIISSTSAVPPDSPSSLVLREQPTMDSCTIAWNPPHDNGGSRVDSYEVQLQAKGPAAVELMGSDWMTIFNGDALGCAIASLRPGCSYWCRVRARNPSGWGLFGIPIDITAAPNVPDTPRAPSYRTLKPRSLGIEWAPPSYNGGSAINGFKIMIAQSVPCSCSQCLPDPSQLPKWVLLKPCEQSLPGNYVIDTVAGHVQIMDIDDLSPGQHYFVRVLAGNAVGYSEWSQWARFLTPPDCPAPPGQPSTLPAGPGALSINWAAPEDDHGSPVHTFVVEMAPTPLTSEPTSAKDVSEDEEGSRGSHPTEDTPDEDEGLQGTHPPIQAPPSFKVIYQGPVMGCEARGLPPASSFILRVKAINHAGSSMWSKVSTPALTLPSTPGPVHAFTVVSLLTLPSPSPSPPVPSSRQSVSMSAGSDSPSRSRSSSQVESCHDAADLPPPSLPLNPTRCIQVSWAPPLVDHGSPVTCYSVEMAPLGRVKVNKSPSLSSSPLLPGSKGPPFAFSFQNKNPPGSGHPPPLSSPMTSASYPLPPSLQHLQWSVVYSGPSTGCIVDRLPPGRSYAFRVKASNQMGWGGLCDSLVTSTLPGAPSPPPRLTAMSVSGQQAGSGKGEGKKGPLPQAPGSGLKVKWDPPEDDHGAPLLAYILELAEGQSSHSASDADQQAPSLEWISVYRGPEVTTRVADLIPGHQYWLRVRACNAAGQGDASEPITAITSLSPPSPPSQVKVSIRPMAKEAMEGTRRDKGGLFTLEVTWDPPHTSPHSAFPIGFEALVLPSDPSSQPSVKNEEGKGSVRVNVGKGEDRAVISGLGSGLCYSVRVRAVGAEGAGHSLWSTDVKFTTLSGSKGLSHSASHSSILPPAAPSTVSSTEESDESNPTQALPVVSHSVNQQPGKNQGKNKSTRAHRADKSDPSHATLSLPPSSSHTPPLARRVANSSSRTWKAWRKVTTKRLAAWVRVNILKILAALLTLLACLTWKSSWLKFRGVFNEDKLE